MSYVLIDGFKRYYHNQGRIITFEDMQEASNFLDAFAQYAMKRAVSENVFLAGDVQQCIQSTTIIEKPNSGTCGYISYDDLRKEKGI